MAAPRALTSKRALFDTRLAVVQMLKDGVVHLAAAGHEEYETPAKEFPRALDDKTGVRAATRARRKQHAGLIEVDTQPGEFTEIRVILPRAAVVP